MSDVFNPYHQWLGLDPQLVQPNYYQLLGFNNFVSDVPTILAAANRAAAHVRGQKPGPYAAYWSRLLDEIEIAKRCLIDPNSRAAYDQWLCGGTVPGQVAPQQPPQTYPTGAAPQPGQPYYPYPQQPYPQPQGGTTPGGYPAGYDPATGQPIGQPTQPVAPQPAAPQPAAPQPAAPQPAAPQPAAPQPAGSHPQPAREPPSVAQRPAQSPRRQEPPPPQTPTPPIARQTTPPPPKTDVTTPKTPITTGGGNRSFSVRASNRKERSPLGVIVIGGGSLLALVVILVVLMSTPGGPEPTEQTAQESPPATGQPISANYDPLEERRTDLPAKSPEQATSSSAVVTEQEPEQQEPAAIDGKEEPTVPDPSSDDDTADIPDMTSSDAVPSGDGAGDAGEEAAMDAAPSAPDIPNFDASSGSFESEPESSSNPSEMAQEEGSAGSPEPAEENLADENPADENPAEKETEMDNASTDAASPDSLGPLLQAVRDDLHTKAYDAAESKLTKAEGLATSDEHKAMVSRLRLMAEYAREFHEAMQNGYNKLTPNTEIDVGTGDEATVVYVADVTEKGVLIRVMGKTIRFESIDEMDFGLAVAVGAKEIGMDGPRTALRRGSFVATVADPDDEDVLAKVRSWLESAAKYVDDAKLLLQTLDDSYDF